MFFVLWSDFFQSHFSARQTLTSFDGVFAGMQIYQNILMCKSFLNYFFTGIHHFNF